MRARIETFVAISGGSVAHADPQHIDPSPIFGEGKDGRETIER
jgi:hypothetical protein